MRVVQSSKKPSGHQQSAGGSPHLPQALGV